MVVRGMGPHRVQVEVVVSPQSMWISDWVAVMSMVIPLVVVVVVMGFVVGKSTQMGSAMAQAFHSLLAGSGDHVSCGAGIDSWARAKAAAVWGDRPVVGGVGVSVVGVVRVVGS